MLLTPHVLTGIAIGTLIQNPIIAVPLSIASHFGLDLMPHWDFYSKTSRDQRIKGWRPIAVMGDFGIAIAIGMFFSLHAMWNQSDTMQALTLFLCGIGSVLPDALEVPHVYMENEPRISYLVYSVQHKLQFQAPLPWGILTQLFVCGASLLLILHSII